MPTEEYKQEERAKLEFEAECPSCGASIEFNPAVGKLKCPYCDFETDIAVPEDEEEKVVREMDFHEAEERGNFDWGTEKKTVICETCAAETIYDALQVADSCTYCGSHQVMEASTKNTLAPNAVCTFEVTDKQAGDHFYKWIKGRWFMPKAAKDSAKPDSFKGVYLPYWTFDSKTSSRYTARYGKHRTVRDKDGKTRIETDWYSTTGFYQEFIDDHLVHATARYDRNMMRKIEPFNLLQNKSYKPEYLAGFLAERYSIGLEAGWNQAKQGIHDHLDSEITAKIRREKHADTVASLRFSTTHDAITYKYLMLPIWLSSFQYKDKVFHFMVNGQTGRVGGDTPISPLRVALAIMVGLLVVAILWFFFAAE